MKTIREWFKELEEPYRSQALKNAEEFESLDYKEESIIYALMGGFMWIYSPQGYKYWQNLLEALINK